MSGLSDDLPDPGPLVDPDPLGREDSLLSAEAQLAAAEAELRDAQIELPPELILRTLRAARRAQLRYYPI